MAMCLPPFGNQFPQFPQGQQGETGVDNRLENQFNRTLWGMETGQLNPGEADGMLCQDMGVFKQMNQDLRTDGGNLTAEQTYQLGQQLNGVSNQIGGFEQGDPYPGQYLPTEGVGSGPDPDSLLWLENA